MTACIHGNLKTFRRLSLRFRASLLLLSHASTKSNYQARFRRLTVLRFKAAEMINDWKCLWIICISYVLMSSIFIQPYTRYIYMCVFSVFNLLELSSGKTFWKLIVENVFSILAKCLIRSRCLCISTVLLYSICQSSYAAVSLYTWQWTGVHKDEKYILPVAFGIIPSHLCSQHLPSTWNNISR